MPAQLQGPWCACIAVGQWVACTVLPRVRECGPTQQNLTPTASRHDVACGRWGDPSCVTNMACPCHHRHQHQPHTTSDATTTSSRRRPPARRAAKPCVRRRLVLSRRCCCQRCLGGRRQRCGAARCHVACQCLDQAVLAQLAADHHKRQLGVGCGALALRAGDHRWDVCASVSSPGAAWQRVGWLAVRGWCVVKGAPGSWPHAHKRMANTRPHASMNAATHACSPSPPPSTPHPTHHCRQHAPAPGFCGAHPPCF